MASLRRPEKFAVLVCNLRCDLRTFLDARFKIRAAKLRQPPFRKFRLVPKRRSLVALPRCVRAGRDHPVPKAVEFNRVAGC